MKELVTNSRTMFLVSHAMSSVRDLCNDCIWLHKGKVMMRGEPDEVIAAYTKFLQVGEKESVSLEDL
jgi:ABC-type polysaccharide/polyol phosphate transport system ATPase subunit